MYFFEGGWRGISGMEEANQGNTGVEEVEEETNTQDNNNNGKTAISCAHVCRDRKSLLFFLQPPFHPLHTLGPHFRNNLPSKNEIK